MKLLPLLYKTQPEKSTRRRKAGVRQYFGGYKIGEGREGYDEKRRDEEKLALGE
jgi:hypothetical protein